MGEWILGRVEDSKTFQNQMAQCFFIGLYDIETEDDFYFFQKFFFDRWKWILKKSIFRRETSQELRMLSRSLSVY